MHIQRLRVPHVALTFAAVGAAGLLAAGCGSGPATSAAKNTAAIKVPSGALGQPGAIRYCSDISDPPLEFYANGQQPTGSDIALGDAIAHELGVQPVWVNTTFAGIIPALQAGHCDAIISQLFDKPSRRAVVNFVDYMNSSEAVLVRKGNPHNVTGIGGLCGLSVAAETGTTITEFLTQESKTCMAHGRKPVSVQTFLRDSDAVDQLVLGHVDAYGTTVETGGYDMSKNPGTFQFAGPPFGQILTGIATVRQNLSLHRVIAAAFAALQRNGTYQKIMTRWNLKPDLLKQG